MNRSTKLHTFLSTLLIVIVTACTGQKESRIVPPVEHPEAYIQVTNQRAEKIVSQTVLNDSVKVKRVIDIIARQYRDLSAIQDTRDADIEAIEKEKGSEDEHKVESQIQEIRRKANMQTKMLHERFIFRLSAELDSAQIVQVKDGMTYNVVPITYKAYLNLLPGLTEEQKAEIKAHLTEAREHAMDAGSSEKKHHIFNDYKGKINNYLSAEGYDLKEAEEQLRRRRESQSDNNTN